MVWGYPSRKTQLIIENVGASKKVPKLDHSKSEFFNLVADALSWLFRNQHKVLPITRQETVFSNIEIDSQRLQPCYKEEADEGIFLHAMEQSRLGFKRLMIVIVDRDVVAISLYAHWDFKVTELWIKVVTRKDPWWLLAYSYAELFGNRVCRAVSFWYAFTGCHIVSQFFPYNITMTSMQGFSRSGRWF